MAVTLTVTIHPGRGTVVGEGKGEVAEFTLARNKFRMPRRVLSFQSPGGRWGPKVRDRWSHSSRVSSRQLAAQETPG